MPDEQPQPLSVRLLGAGVRAGRTVSRAAGIDKAVEVAAEEAMVAAVQSEAVERALARVLQGPVVEDAVQGALQSEALKRALIEALDSELVDEVWRRLLASDEAQKLVERIAEAPEIRAAISAQSAGLVEDIGRTIGDGTRRADGVLERLARKAFFRRPRLEPTERAGALTRALAFAADAAIINLTFSATAAIVALIGSAITGGAGEVPALALALGSSAWLALGAAYMVAFWSLAGQTPGMRLLGIRLAASGEEKGLTLRQSCRRLIGFGLAVIPLGLGFLGILFDNRRRGWQDRLSGTDVVYDRNEPTPAPWSRLDAPEPHAVGQPGAPAPPPSASLHPPRVA